MDQEQAWHRIHEDTISVRNKELDVFWALNGFFSLILIGILGFTLTELEDKNIYIQEGGCLFGMILSVVWGGCLQRIGEWLSFWNRELVHLQRNVPSDIRVFGGVRYDKERKNDERPVTDIMLILIGLFLIARILVGIYFSLGNM